MNKNNELEILRDLKGVWFNGFILSMFCVCNLVEFNWW